MPFPVAQSIDADDVSIAPQGEGIAALKFNVDHVNFFGGRGKEGVYN